MPVTPEDSARIHLMIERGRQDVPAFDEKARKVTAQTRDLDAMGVALASMADGHKVLARMAEDPGSADVLKHNGVRLASALGRYAGKGEKAATEAAKPAEKPAEKPRAVTEARDMRDYDDLRTGERDRKTKPAQPKGTDIHDTGISLGDFFAVRDKSDENRQTARRQKMAEPFAGRRR